MDQEQTILKLSVFLARIARLNDKSPTATTRYHSASVPPISLLLYIQRIAQYCQLDTPVLLYPLVLLDRAGKCGFWFDSYTQHRFALVCLLIGCKVLDDVYPSNTWFAKVGGIPLAELNLLELETAEMLGYELGFSSDEYAFYLGHLTNVVV